MQNIYNAPLSEEETKLRYITPALENAGWDKKRIRMELYLRVLHKECYNDILQLRSSLCNTVQNVRQSGL